MSVNALVTLLHALKSDPISTNNISNHTAMLRVVYYRVNVLGGVNSSDVSGCVGGCAGKGDALWV